MTSATDSIDTPEDPHAQIARLRAQIESLLKDRVPPAVAEFASRAETAVHCASGAVRGQAEALSGKVKEQPLLSVAIAAGIGWLIGRAMR
jgi:ElaB/YqjD/DUF883 family membrane-anchored ribosome-binding protein